METSFPVAEFIRRDHREMPAPRASRSMEHAWQDWIITLQWKGAVIRDEIDGRSTDARRSPPTALNAVCRLLDKARAGLTSGQPG